MNVSILTDIINKLKAEMPLSPQAALCAPDVMRAINEMFTDIQPEKTPFSGVISVFSGVQLFTHDKIPKGIIYFGTKQQIGELIYLLEHISIQDFEQHIRKSPNGVK